MVYESKTEPPALQDLPDATDAIKRDRRRFDMKIAVIDCLNSFFSGSLEDDEFAQQMLSLLNLWEIAKHLKDCEVIWTKAKQYKEFAQLAELTLKEGTSYSILMRQLMFFDKDRTVLSPIISDPLIAPAWDFFQRRSGYVEILRHGTLEGFYYPLPDDLGDEASLFDKMYETEREDIDKKNYEWLFIMTNLIERVERHAQIRQGVMAFSVNYFSSVTRFCLCCAFCIHFLCIVGNYKATDEYVALQLQAQGRDSQVEDNPLLNTDTGFELTEQDTYFFRRVEEPMRWIIRVMCWINLAACALRFASFVIAELPLVVRLGLKMKEEEAAEEELNFHEELEGEQEEHEEEDVAPILQIDLEQSSAESSKLMEVPPTDEDSEASSPQNDWKTIMLESIKVVFSSQRTLYEMLYIIFAVLAVVYDEPLATAFSLFGEKCRSQLPCVCLCARVSYTWCMGVFVCLQIFASGQALPQYWMRSGTMQAKWGRPSCSDCYACISGW